MFRRERYLYLLYRLYVTDHIKDTTLLIPPHTPTTTPSAPGLCLSDNCLILSQAIIIIIVGKTPGRAEFAFGK